MEIGLPEIGWLEIGDWISCCALLVRLDIQRIAW